MRLLHWLVLAHVALNLGTFAFKLPQVFDRAAGVAFGMRVLGLAGATAALLHVTLLATSQVSPIAALAGVTLCSAGLALFRWAASVTRARPLTLAFSRDSPQHLVTGGPYAWVRHPFYTSYSLTWLGSAVAAGRWEVWVTTAAMLLLYKHAADLEERKFASSMWAGEYQSYRLRTGMFLPRPAGLVRSFLRRT